LLKVIFTTPIATVDDWSMDIAFPTNMFDSCEPALTYLEGVNPYDPTSVNKFFTIDNNGSKLEIKNLKAVAAST
jgi:hypothetical protein